VRGCPQIDPTDDEPLLIGLRAAVSGAQSSLGRRVLYR